MAVTNDLIPDFDDFERYYSSEMPLAEQRLLEGRMLAEPMVAEAYEGFLAWRTRNASGSAAHADLRGRLHTRVARARRRAMPLWTYASAASVLLAVFSYWFVFLREQKEGMQKPATIVKQEEAASSASKEVPAPIQREEPIESAPPKAPNPATSISTDQPNQAPQALSKPEIALAPAVPADKQAVEKAGDIALEDSFAVETEVVHVAPQPAKALATPGSAQAVGKSIEERARREKVDTHYLVASKPVSAQKESYNIAIPADTLAAVPMEGWPSYRAYLDKNTGSASTTGQIVVTFVVSSSGALSGFIAKGPEELQKEAIRIISNGPAWAPARTKGIPVASPVEIQLQFRQAQ